MCVKCGGEGIWGFLTPKALLPKDVIDPGLGRLGRFRKAAAGAPNNLCGGVGRVVTVQGFQR